MYRLTLAFALALAASQATAETMYQWTDDRGGRQFGQQPPADRPFQKVDIRAAPNLGSPVRSQQPAPVKPAEAVEPDGDKAKSKQEQEAVRQANCDRLRENLKTLSENPRLSRKNEAGEVERIGEDERQSMIAEAKQNLATHCVNN
ncbi:DUF4124 domain-containing protein [Halopseudomonas nanhaiensis]|uniref:DUF4124 domain-containing protein n=1 Tax=Halopseudomonas nanhaiensis TaxID=2830842 RepID=UPI001CC07E30|nr:DUF4124 domain-containing protein [Halopseudomonas nanhaiensis]UAW97944.1 DUF4124 domain-containing protein [Halopseudomonas nanhaiensis]